MCVCVCHMAGCVSGCVRVQLCCEKQREEHDRDGERVCVSVCVVAVGGDGGAGVAAGDAAHSLDPDSHLCRTPRCVCFINQYDR